MDLGKYVYWIDRELYPTVYAQVYNSVYNDLWGEVNRFTWNKLGVEMGIEVASKLERETWN